jgi:hypothetical protein
VRNVCQIPGCPCQRGLDVVVADNFEVSASCASRLTRDDFSEIYRALAGGDPTLTSRAADRVASFPRGGSLDTLARLVVRGELVLLRRQRELIAGGGSGQAAPSEPTPAAPAEPSTEEAWVKFKVVDDDTGSPIAGVKLRIREPNGQEREYTTRADGMIEIDPVDPGACDILEMTDADGFEVVSVE